MQQSLLSTSMNNNGSDNISNEQLGLPSSLKLGENKLGKSVVKSISHIPKETQFDAYSGLFLEQPNDNNTIFEVYYRILFNL